MRRAVANALRHFDRIIVIGCKVRHDAFTGSLATALEFSNRATCGTIDGEVDGGVRAVTFAGDDEQAAAAPGHGLTMPGSADTPEFDEDATRVPTILLFETNRNAADAITVAIEREGEPTLDVLGEVLGKIAAIRDDVHVMDTLSAGLPERPMPRDLQFCR